MYYDQVGIFIIALVAAILLNPRIFLFPIVIVISSLIQLSLWWQDMHGNPGWFAPAFAEYLSTLVASAMIGLFIGGVFLGQDSIFRKKKNLK